MITNCEDVEIEFESGLKLHWQPSWPSARVSNFVGPGPDFWDRPQCQWPGSLARSLEGCQT